VGGRSKRRLGICRSTMTMDLPTALNTLANHRIHNLRKSQETFDAGIVVLDKNALGKLGDDSEESRSSYRELRAHVGQVGHSSSNSLWLHSTLGVSMSLMYVCAFIAYMK
jgi:hypothetical protein